MSGLEYTMWNSVVVAMPGDMADRIDSESGGNLSFQVKDGMIYIYERQSGGGMALRRSYVQRNVLYIGEGK